MEGNKKEILEKREWIEKYLPITRYVILGEGVILEGVTETQLQLAKREPNYKN